MSLIISDINHRDGGTQKACLDAYGANLRVRPRFLGNSHVYKSFKKGALASLADNVGSMMGH